MRCTGMGAWRLYFNPRSREGSDNTVYTNGIQAV